MRLVSLPILRYRKPRPPRSLYRFPRTPVEGRRGPPALAPLSPGISSSASVATPPFGRRALDAPPRLAGRRQASTPLVFPLDQPLQEAQTNEHHRLAKTSRTPDPFLKPLRMPCTAISWLRDQRSGPGLEITTCGQRWRNCAIRRRLPPLKPLRMPCTAISWLRDQRSGPGLEITTCGQRWRNCAIRRYPGHDPLPRLDPQRPHLLDATANLRLPSHRHQSRTPASTRRRRSARPDLLDVSDHAAVTTSTAALVGGRSGRRRGRRRTGRRGPRSPGRRNRGRAPAPYALGGLSLVRLSEFP